jgi:hypothetical protein
MRRFLLFSAIVGALLLRVAAADQPTKPESSATGILKITADRDSILVNVAVPLLSTKPLLKEAISNVSKEAALELYQVASVETKYDGGGITVTANSFDERVPADKLLAKLADALSVKLRGMDVEHLRDETRTDRLALEVERIAKNLVVEHDALANLAAIHRVSTNVELNDQKQMRLDAELQSLDVQTQGLHARQKVLEAQIAELAKKITAGGGADPDVLRELMKSVEARKRIVEASQAAYDKQSIAVAPLEEAKDALGKAQVELAKYRRAAADAAGGGRIKELKGRLDDTAIELAEISARRDAVQKQLEQASGASAQVEIKRMYVERLRQDYRDASDELSKWRMKLKLYVPPSVQLVPLQ